ncbi:MAG TPA: tyrosine--tRNA ligase [Candidatus Yonathbacteria bacterium]|nr:tyrosine--tRNA ligase [Candidatus Yonathbacteria bacterium]
MYTDGKSTNLHIEEVFSRGVGEFIDPGNTFKEKLQKKVQGVYTKDIIIKFGVDPTSPDIHIGHAVILRKLRMLQDLGCKVVFLVGDFTANIGDPTGKNKMRPEIQQKEIEANMKTYLDQVGKILHTDQVLFSWIRNSDWFYGITDLNPKESLAVRIGTTIVNPKSFVGKAKLYEDTRMQKTHLKKEATIGITLSTLMWTLKHITYNRLIQRDMFQERIKKGHELYMHEMLYPILQGMDSSVIYQIYGACDLEIGGTDQTFNMLIGRDIMKATKQTPQAVLACDLLEGIDGREKMSKSLNNYISIIDTPNDMYGKVMSISDDKIESYFSLSTYTPVDKIKKFLSDMQYNKVNPRDVKMKLAYQITALYHGEANAKSAEEVFTKTFQKKEIPDGIQEEAVDIGVTLGNALVSLNMVSSKKEFQRLINEGAIKIDGNKILDIYQKVETEVVVKIGKKKFVKLSPHKK